MQTSILVSMDDAVWLDTTDGGLLRQLFGHYPTLHEARLISLDLDEANKMLVAEVEYEDESEDDRPLRVAMRLEWHEVTSVDLQIAGSEILTMHFDRSGPKLTTHLQPCSGTHGKIVSERFEAFLREANVLRSDTEGVRIRYGIAASGDSA